MQPKIKVPIRLVTEKSMTYGYRGYPNIYIKLECGHFEFHEQFSRYEKIVPKKSKIKCWQCWRKIQNENKTNVEASHSKLAQ
jgi:hypothetical protein